MNRLLFKSVGGMLTGEGACLPRVSLPALARYDFGIRLVLSQFVEHC